MAATPNASSPSRPRVLVVDDDPRTRRMVRMAIEVEGGAAVEAASVDEATKKAEEGDWTAVAVSAPLAMGKWQALLGASARVIALAPDGTEVEAPDGVVVVPVADLPAVVRAMGLTSLRHSRLAVVDLLLSEATDVEDDWRELCRWDPMLPPDSQPPIAAAVVAALAEAMGRPQPLGWGPDPEVEKVAEVYARAVGSIDTAIGQLICLREAMRRRVASRIPPEEWAETDDRLHMVVDRAIAVAASRTAERLQEQAYIDSLTGLLNRRALERDLRREIGRATRADRMFGVVYIDLDGLKHTNDTQGHAAGDEKLRHLAGAIQTSLRLGDAAYRTGGDEFVMLLPDTDDEGIDTVVNRVRSANAPAFSSGSSVFPDDGMEMPALLAVADHRLLDDKRERKIGS